MIVYECLRKFKGSHKGLWSNLGKRLLGALSTPRIKWAREENCSNRTGEWPLTVECLPSEQLPIRNSPPSGSYGLQERDTGT